MFKVVKRYPSSPFPDTVYLVEDSWDDWFKFKTVYTVYHYNAHKIGSLIGSVKIGQFNMIDIKRPELPEEFITLGEQYFSLGQDDSYYVNLQQLGQEFSQSILVGIRDIAFDENIYNSSIHEEVTRESLLRSVSLTSVKGQFRRLARGGARLSPYNFTYNAPTMRPGLESLRLNFEVIPESNPPSNIHVLIGRNGVGKTHLLNGMINAITDANTFENKGTFESQSHSLGLPLFANLVSVTFSAFDESEPKEELKDGTKTTKYSYIGLKQIAVKAPNGDAIPISPDKLGPKSPHQLNEEFVLSIKAIKSASALLRWKSWVQMLEKDPMFKDSEVATIADERSDAYKAKAASIFAKLSSGHKIVLLTLTKLVEVVEERTLVLMDEPEAHLHPPLLSAFIRVLSEILIHSNGVAIIATHSPVVLQEVPRSCVYKLRRNGSVAKAERLELESFGENVGTLTREVFGLEVTNSGFHKMISEVIGRWTTYDEVLEKFGNELGLEALSIIQAIINTRDDTQNS